MRRISQPLLRGSFIIVTACGLMAQATIAGEITQVPSKTVVESVEGRKYEVLRISRKSADSITFTHAGGVVTFRANELTLESQQILGMQSVTTPKQNSAFDPSKPLPDFSTPATAQKCTACKGRKTILCVTCRGSGFGQDVQNSAKCPTCSGIGSVSKPVLRTVNRGALKQNDSYVSHHKNELCAKCNGSGKLVSSSRGYCTACQGRQTIPCPDCR